MLIGQRSSQMGRISPYNDINERRISGILKEYILKRVSISKNIVYAITWIECFVLFKCFVNLKGAIGDYLHIPIAIIKLKGSYDAISCFPFL